MVYVLRRMAETCPSLQYISRTSRSNLWKQYCPEDLVVAETYQLQHELTGLARQRNSRCSSRVEMGQQDRHPKIQGLSELPSVPFFGSLFMLGKYHARSCAKLRYQFGDVFQVRLGNRVGQSLSEGVTALT